MRPTFLLTADGRDITAAVNDRLLSLSVHDEAGLKSDRLTLKIDDRVRLDGAYAELPKIGTVLGVSLGYVETGMVEMGRYVVDEIGYGSPPATLDIQARAADMPKPFRSATTRSWDATTLGAIARTLAAENGYEAAVAGELDGVKIAHADQTAESPMAFLNRLAEDHDAIVKPAAGRLVVAPRGAGKSVSGRDLPSLTIGLEDLTNWTYRYSAREDSGESAGKAEGEAETANASGSGGGGVKTVYWDHDEGTEKAILAGDPPYEVVRFASANAPEAAASATKTKNKSSRKKGTFEATLPGNPHLGAEQRLTVTGLRPGVPTDWRLTSVEHGIDGKGYVTRIQAELWQAGQANVAQAKARAEAPDP